MSNRNQAPKGRYRVSEIDIRYADGLIGNPGKYWTLVGDYLFLWWAKLVTRRVRGRWWQRLRGYEASGRFHRQLYDDQNNWIYHCDGGQPYAP